MCSHCPSHCLSLSSPGLLCNRAQTAQESLRLIRHSEMLGVGYKKKTRGRKNDGEACEKRRWARSEDCLQMSRPSNGTMLDLRFVLGHTFLQSKLHPTSDQAGEGRLGVFWVFLPVRPYAHIKLCFCVGGGRLELVG